MTQNILFAGLVLSFLSGGEPAVEIAFDGFLGDDGFLSAPQNLACSPEGSLWVADTGETRIHLFSPAGKHIRSFGGFGQGVSEFTDRVSLVDPGGLYLYAADVDGARVLKMTRVGLTATEIRLKDEYDSEWIWRPIAMASRIGGSTFILDSGNGDLYVLDLFDGLSELSGREAGEATAVWDPAGLAFAGDRLYLTDRVMNEIVILDRFGNYLEKLPFPGTPSAIDVRADGLMAVVDELSGDVVLLGGGIGDAIRVSARLPDLELKEPVDVCFCDHDCLFIADAGNNRVVRLKVSIHRPETEYSDH